MISARDRRAPSVVVDPARDGEDTGGVWFAAGTPRFGDN